MYSYTYYIYQTYIDYDGVDKKLEEYLFLSPLKKLKITKKVEMNVYWSLPSNNYLDTGKHSTFQTEI